MNAISAKFLRENLQVIVEDVVKTNANYTVIYRSKPVFEIIPIQSKTKINVEGWLNAATGIATAKDIEKPKNDKNILKKRLLKKSGKNIS